METHRLHGLTLPFHRDLVVRHRGGDLPVVHKLFEHVNGDPGVRVPLGV
jgi:hypothetical protein